MARKNNNEDSREYRAMQRRIKFLKICLNYLKENPSEDFITKQFKQLKTKFDRITNGFQDWRNWQQTTKEKTPQQWLSEYNSFMGTNHVKEQIQTLKFILS